MSLLHGTSARVALKILAGHDVEPSANGVFYCFKSKWLESLAGALCFATGNGARAGSLPLHDYVADYAALNPKFPEGVAGAFLQSTLKLIGDFWAEDKVKNMNDKVDLSPAILVFHDHSSATDVVRGGVVRETLVPSDAFQDLTLKRVFIDDDFMDAPEVKEAIANGIDVHPISEAANTLSVCVDRKSDHSQNHLLPPIF
jgi:hypothetical protein